MTTNASVSNASGWVNYPDVVNEIPRVMGVTTMRIPLTYGNTELIRHGDVDAVYIIATNPSGVEDVVVENGGVVPTTLHTGKGAFVTLNGNIVESNVMGNVLTVSSNLIGQTVTVVASHVIITRGIVRLGNDASTFNDYRLGYQYTLCGVTPPYQNMSPLHVVDRKNKFAHLAHVPANDPKRGMWHRPDMTQHIKYMQSVDPAMYGNNGIVTDNLTQWTDDHVGQIWVDMASIGYTPYTRTDAYNSTDERLQAWAAPTSWSSFDVYEWVESEVSPELWEGDGTPKTAIIWTTSDGNTQLIDDVEVYQVRPQNVIDGRFIQIGSLAMYSNDQLFDYCVNGVTVDSANLVRATTVTTAEQLAKIGADDWFVMQIEGDADFNKLCQRTTDSYVVKYAHDLSPFVVIPESVTWSANVQHDLVATHVLSDGSVIMVNDGTFTLTMPHSVKSKLVGSEVVSRYYFWVKDNAVTKPIRSAYIDRSSPYFFITGGVQEYDQVAYSNLVVRNIRHIVTDNSRYGLAIHHDPTLAQTNHITVPYDLTRKPQHIEYNTQRRLQSQHIDKTLWAKLVDSMTGSLPSEQYIGTNGWGMLDGQAMADAAGLLNTVIYTMRMLERDNLYDWNVRVTDVLARFDVNNPLELQALMDALYRTQSSTAINTIFFNALTYALTTRTDYPGVLKTSMVAVRGSQTLDVHNVKYN